MTSPDAQPTPRTPTDEERMAFKRRELESIRPAFMGPPEGAERCPMCGHELVRSEGTPDR